jgi:hypothetical protein
MVASSSVSAGVSTGASGAGSVADSVTEASGAGVVCFAGCGQPTKNIKENRAKQGIREWIFMGK